MADLTITITCHEAILRDFAFHRRGLLGSARMVADAVDAALPKPRPDEPMGLGAVVRDGEGRVWVRIGNTIYPWRCEGGSNFAVYADIPNPIEVLSEGVEIR